MIGLLVVIRLSVKFVRRMRVLTFLVHISNLREPLRILFEKFASDHSVAIYGEPSPEVLENAKARRIEVKVFSFLKGL